MYIQFLIVLFGFIYAQDYSYSLEDINPTSPYYDNSVSPSNFSGQVTLHYFGHQN